jgi:Spy/CpxP family protein refolding chaperone
MAAAGAGQEGPDSFDVALGDPMFDGSGIILAQQEPGMPGRMRGPGMMPPMDSGVQRKHIEQLRLLKMLEVLDLTEDHEPQFLMAFKGMRKAMRNLDESKQTIIRRLSKELKAEKPDTRQINNLVDSVLMIEAHKRESMQKFVDSSRAILTPIQIGRLLVFTERFEFELLERVREFRERQAPKGPGPGNIEDSQ